MACDIILGDLMSRPRSLRRWSGARLYGLRSPRASSGAMSCAGKLPRQHQSRGHREVAVALPGRRVAPQRAVIRASHHCHLMPANSRKSLRSGILNSINAKRMLVVVAGVVGLAGAAHGADISGAGATFPYPVYSKWA